MRRALRLAECGLGATSPNPCVGALVVRGRRVLGEGWHRKAGMPHAEVEALRAAEAAGEDVRGATLVVTLEPCCTHGRTPPCTEAIIRAGLKRVVVGATDPNPAHAGRAYEILRAAGVEVVAGVLGEEATFLNRGFNRWVTTGRPWVIGKAAMSLDGGLTRPDGRRWLTGTRARQDAHRLRAACDAILVGAGTLRADDPQLTVRGVEGFGEGEVREQPWRVVVTRSGELPRLARVFTDLYRERTLVYRSQSWLEVLEDLGRRGVTRLLVEGGGAVLDDLSRQGLVDEAVIYYAPLDFSGREDVVRAEAFRALALERMSVRALGMDLKIQGVVRR